MDWLSTIIGAAIGFVASVGTIIVERIIDRNGKLKIYYVMVYGDKITNQFGFSKDASNGIAFIAPMKLEIQNTSNVTRVIRDVSLLMYKNDVCIGNMIQITSTENKKTTNGKITDLQTHEYGGEKNSYSFVIPPRSIQRQYCTFMYTIEAGKEAPAEFNEIRLRYFDETDKAHIFFVRKIESCWKLARLHGDEDWILLK